MKRTFKAVVAIALMAATLLGFVPAFSAEIEVAAAERKTYKHVVVVGIDGMGNFNQKCSTPNIDRIFKNNPKAAWTDYCMASNPNISAQCWTSMLTGVMPNVHGITNDIVENTGIKYNNATYPTLFKYIRQSRPNAKMACYSSWIGPANGMVETGLNVDTLYTSYNDATLATESVKYIKNNKPEFFFCVFNDVDAAGHSYNWGSTQYLAALTKVDGYLGQIYDAVSQAGMLEDTLFICTTDHGGWTNGHGVRTTSTKYTFFGAVGGSINPNTNLYVRGVDLAAIVGYAMNVPGNDKWEAVVPQYMFKDNMNPKFSPHPDTLTAAHHHSSPRVTPASGLKDYMGNFVDMNKLEMALFFDDNVNDYMGNQTTVAKGTVKYEDGYFGKGVNLENGYISVPNLKMGTDSFSVGVWMKQKGDYPDSADPVIFCNKNWSSGYGNSDGVVLTEWGNNPAFRVSKNNTNNQVRATYPGEAQTTIDIDTSGANWVPTSYDDCWVHLLLVVDRPNNKVKIYYNFVLSGEFTMESWVNGMSFDTGLPFTIGQDADGDCGVQLKSKLDDFLFFNSTLDQADIDGLRKYYTPVVTGSAPTYATITTDKSAYNLGETVKLSMDADGYSNTLWVYKPDGTSQYFQQASSPYTMTFNAKGEYSALVQTWNGKGSCTSEKVYFTVGVETTTKPTTQPTTEPTTQPTTEPTTQPTTEPTTQPTTKPTTQPTTKPTTQPTTQPTASTKKLTIVKQPKTVCAKNGETVSVKVVAEGDGLIYRWYIKNAGASKYTYSSTFKGDTYTLTMTDARAGRRVLCIIQDKYGNKVQSSSAMFVQPVQIILQPSDVCASNGETVTLKVVAEGEGLSYRWYFKDAGAKDYTYTSSFKKNTYSVEMTDARAGRRVLCRVYDKFGNVVKSKSALLCQPVKITQQPKNVCANNGESITLKVVAKGEGLSHRWYYKDAGATEYTYTSSFKGNTYSVEMTDARAGRRILCRVYDKFGNVVKSKSVVIAQPVKITKQPKSVTVANGKTARVTVTAEGEGLTYAWYYANAGDTAFTYTASFQDYDYAVKMNDSRAGRQVCCVVTDMFGNSVTSGIAFLNMK